MLAEMPLTASGVETSRGGGGGGREIWEGERRKVGGGKDGK